jgi:accessory colonization factor AcfC
MKKFAFVLVLIGLALSASAADYTITLSAGEETVLNKVRLHLNRQTCDRLRLAPGCTQEEAEAVDASAVIYGTSAAQVSALIKKLAVDAVQTIKAQRDASAESDLMLLIHNGSPAQKDAACAAVGLPAGCYAP